MKTTGTSTNRLGNWWRVLRPLFWWFLLVLVMFGIRTHERLMERTRINFAISMDGQYPIYNATLRLDGQPIVSGQNISLGSHNFSVSHPKGEPFATNFFAWYGPQDFGQINLKRTKGLLNVQTSPAAATITITGPEYSTTLHDSTGTNINVPADPYTINVQYPHWSQSQDVTVFDNQTASSTFAPQIGALHVTCNHEGATYQLNSFADENVGSGNFPIIITGLPARRYNVTVFYHNRETQKSIFIQANQTNEVRIDFVLGAAHLESDPAGAEVRTADGNYLGQTPLDLADLDPKTVQFNISLNGYQPLAVNLAIVADQTNSVHTNLVSLEYLNTMQEARRYMGAFDYKNVVLETKAALNAKPDDVEALALQNEASQYLDVEQKRRDRLQRPRLVFNELCSHNPDASLFAEHEFKTRSPAKEAEAAIVKSLQAAPNGFQVSVDESPAPETYQVMAQQTFSLGILGGTQRVCLLVVGQTKDDETEILYKVLEYQIQHTLVNFRDVKQVIPVNSTRLEMTDMQLMQIQDGVKIVSERIHNCVDNLTR